MTRYKTKKKNIYETEIKNIQDILFKSGFTFKTQSTVDFTVIDEQITEKLQQNKTQQMKIQHKQYLE
jgi:hypothetical protein